LNRYILIGDLHANHIGLEKLLKLAKYNENEDCLIFLGNYIDNLNYNKFSAKKTVDHLLKLKSKSEKIFFVKGNNDLFFINLLNSKKFSSVWIRNGGRQILQSYGINDFDKLQLQIEKIPYSHRLFFSNILQDYYIDKNIIAVHGGFVNEEQMIAVSNNEVLSSELLHQITWDKKFIFSKLDEDKNMFKKYFKNRKLIVGNTPYGPYQNNKNLNWLLVDGGSKIGKKQLGLIIENDNYNFINEDGFIDFNDN
tara:strand:+ start:8907 stop:9662 length:756 start_codon:yes stop_codon:yes gene_type:complete